MNQQTSISFYANRRIMGMLLGACVIFLSLALYAVKYSYAHDTLFNDGYVPVLGALLPIRNISAFWLFLVCALFLGAATINCLYRLLSSKPRVTVSAEGIWRPGYGLIAWNKIESTAIVMVKSADQAIIGIILKDQAIVDWPRSRRFLMAMNKRICGAHIPLDGYLTMPHHEILAIVKNFQQLSQINTAR